MKKKNPIDFMYKKRTLCEGFTFYYSLRYQTNFNLLFMNNLILAAMLSFSAIALYSCSKDDDDCTKTNWYQDSDQDGLGDPNESIAACEKPDGYVSNNTDSDDTMADGDGLHAAFAEFDNDNYEIYLDGSEVVLVSTGLPNHTSPYWSDSHPLNIDPIVTTTNDMAPGNIDDFNGSYTLRVPISPLKASSSSATGLGPIGVAISGSMIYNDEEGPGVPLDDAAPSLDYTAAHTGPMSYHYHLEPKAWSDDDDVLIGIISDGFFLYGRKCHSTGDYPTDLDASGGHTSTTQHNSDGEYHYHIQNELYLDQYYILFPGDYQGTPNDIQ